MIDRGRWHGVVQRALEAAQHAPLGQFGQELLTGSSSASTPSSTSTMAPAAPMGLESEAMRKMASRRKRRRIVERRMPEHLRVHLAAPGDQGHQPGHPAALGVGGETVVQPPQAGGIEPPAHARRGRSKVMRCDASGSVPPWRPSKTSSR